MGNGVGDELVLPSQMEYMSAARPDRVETMLLGNGTVPWVHANVDEGDLARFHEAEARIADEVAPVRGG